MGGESDDLFKPIKKKDNEWIRFHKLAIQKGGEDLGLCIKEFTKLLIEAGYDSVSVDDEPYWVVLLDKSLIVSVTRHNFESR